jgi:hypothetical protein
MLRHSLVLALALTLLGAPAAPLGQTPAVALTDAQIEQFLKTGRVGRARGTQKGVTGSLRATLSDGTLTHDAQIQFIEQSQREFRGSQGVEFDFRDFWQFNVAAYKIDRLLGLRLVPVSIERPWNGKKAAFTWWIDDVMMDEGERLAKKLSAPDPLCWTEQLYLLRVFDQLIDNIDRNAGNTLITKTWRLWGIDHTRAFRYARTPRTPALMMRIDRAVLQRLQSLDFDTLKRDIGRYLTDVDIRNLLARRDGIVAHFASRGDSVVFDRQDTEEPCRASGN